jgi:hypothetical protein
VNTVIGRKLVARRFVVIRSLAEALGSVPGVVGQNVVIMLGETEPVTGIALHYADLRRYEPIRGRPSGEIIDDD